MSTLDAVLVMSMPALLILSALCSGSETALFSLTRADRAGLARGHPRASRAVESLLSDPRGLLITVLMCNMAVNTTYFTFAALLAGRVGAGGGAVGGAVGLGLVLVLIAAGEVVPKVAAATWRAGLCAIAAPPALWVYRLLTPPRRVLDLGVVAPLTRLVAPARPGAPAHVTPEELSGLLELSAREGRIDAGEQGLLADVISLSSIRVRDVMIPRVDLHWLTEGFGAAELSSLVARTGFTRLLVCRGGLDGTILGWADAKKLMAAAARGRPTVNPALEPPRFVPETARLDALLEHFRRTRSHLALCVNESGGLVGMISIHQVVRQLLAASGAGGDEASAAVRREGDGRWSVPGRLPVRRLTDYVLGTRAMVAGRRRAATVGGLIAESLGRMPAVGDVALVGNIRLVVQSMRGLVIDRVQVSVDTTAEARP